MTKLRDHLNFNPMNLSENSYSWLIHLETFEMITILSQMFNLFNTFYLNLKSYFSVVTWNTVRYWCRQMPSRGRKCVKILKEKEAISQMIIEKTFYKLREAAKKVIFLVTRPLRPLSPSPWPVGPLKNSFFCGFPKLLTLWC